MKEAAENWQAATTFKASKNCWDTAASDRSLDEPAELYVRELISLSDDNE
jgi:hypothetical protein